jgi:RsiW-degrading membrane proteinase PrsW (M82 family)
MSDPDHSVWDEPTTSSELAGPRPPDAPGYAEWLQSRRASFARSWALTLALAAVSGLWGILGALLGSGPSAGLLAVVLFAPLVEEMAKISAPLMIVETRPYLFRSPLQILLCALASGLAFASIENFVYFNIYISNPSPELVAWRWTVCVALHAGCSLIAGLGVARIWRDVWSRRAKPRLAMGLPCFFAAMVVHGLYNSFAVGLALADLRF